MEVDKRIALEQIGNLFYAIAVEQHVRPLEVPELKLMISREWIPKNSLNQEFMVSDATHCIVMTIDANIGAGMSPDEAYDQFADFYHAHSTMFTKEVRDVILETATTITNKFGKQKNNLKLTALKNLLEVAESEPA